MPPSQKRSYPNVNRVQDNPTQQALIELWNVIHDNATAAKLHATDLTDAQSTIDSQQAAIDKLTKQVAIISAGGGISVPSLVGGGGSGGASGGSGSGDPGGGGGGSGGGNGGGPNQDDHPDSTGVVAQAKANLISEGVDISGPCGAFAIVRRTANMLASSQGDVGLLDKPSGNNCDGYATDIICYNDGLIYDVLGDGGGANNPQWSFGGTVSTDRYRPPF